MVAGWWFRHVQQPQDLSILKSWSFSWTPANQSILEQTVRQSVWQLKIKGSYCKNSGNNRVANTEFNVIQVQILTSLKYCCWTLRILCAFKSIKNYQKYFSAYWDWNPHIKCYLKVLMLIVVLLAIQRFWFKQCLYCLFQKLLRFI